MADDSAPPKAEDDVVMGEADSGALPSVPAALSSSTATASVAAAPSPASAANAVPSRQSTQPPEAASVPQALTNSTLNATPAVAVPHGAPTRRYLNEKVTGVLLEGMKELAREQPRDPLRVLGEFLIKRSKEVGETA